MRPLDRRAEGPLARVRVAAAFQQVEPLPQALDELFRREERHPGRRELEREGQVVEARADLGHLSVCAEVDPERMGPGLEERDCVVLGHRRHRVDALPLQLQAFAGRYEHNGRPGSCEQCDVRGHSGKQVLEIVEKQERAPAREGVRQPLRKRRLRRVADAHAMRHRRQDEGRVVERSERNPHDAVRKALGRLGCGLDCQPRLTGSSGTDQRHEVGIVLAEQTDHMLDFVLATQERRSRNRKVAEEAGPQSWELSVTELVEADGCIEILEPVQPEILRLDLREIARRLERRTCAPCPAEQIRAAVWTTRPA